MIRIHFFEGDTKIADKTLNQVPHVGDELRFRFSKTSFYRVIRRVWCYDEEDKPYDRCNVEVESVE